MAISYTHTHTHTHLNHFFYFWRFYIQKKFLVQTCSYKFNGIYILSPYKHHYSNFDHDRYYYYYCCRKKTTTTISFYILIIIITMVIILVITTIYNDIGIQFIDDDDENPWIHRFFLFCLL